MADISDVDTATIKDLYERLESLSCKSSQSNNNMSVLFANFHLLARIMTRILY